MTARVSTGALVLHHLRSRAGGGITVAALVLLLSLLATTAPLALTLLGDASLRERLASLSPTERDVQTTAPGLPQLPGLEALPVDTAETWGEFQAALEGIRTTADAPLPDLLGPARTVTLVGEYPLAADPRTQEIVFATDADLGDEITLVEGRLPEVSSSASDVGGVITPAVVEVVLSVETAAELGWQVGESREIATASFPLQVTLTGVFEATDPDADYWQHVPSVLSPSIFDDGNGPRRVTGTAFTHAASLPDLALLPGEAVTLVWYPLDVSQIDFDTAEEAAAALRKFTSVSHAVGSSAGGTGILSLRFTAEVTGAIEDALAQQAATAAVIAMVIAGPVGVAAAVLVLGCRLILERRRSSLRLLSARGASTGQLRGLLGVEGALVGLVPAAVGAVVAAVVGGVVFGIPPQPAWFVAALLLGVAPLAILWVLAPSAAERQARADLGRRGGRVRLIVEVVVAALAAVALTLLFVRGYAGGTDLLLAATPLLLSLVACLVTLRLYPLPLRGILARARRSPRLDAFVGVARALREPSIGLTPVLALVVGVSVAVSSGVLLSALDEGIAQSSNAQVGADLNVSGGSFTREQLEAVRSIAGVAAATGISGADPSTLDINGEKRATSVFVVDAADLRAVQGDGPGMLPPGVSLEPRAGDMPIVVSGYTADLIGDTDQLRLGSVDAIVVGVTTGPVPVGERENWAAIDASYAEDVLGRDPSDRTILIRLEEGASASAVEESVRGVLGAAVRVTTADEVAAAIESGPAVQGVRIALFAATAVAALLSALAIVMTLTLAAAPRARVVALLRTLGAPRRSSTSLALWEIGPPAIAAIIAGTVFGALVPLVVLAGVDLRPFTGSSVQPVYHVDAATLALTLGGFVVLGAAFTAIALLASRRVRAASTLRTVEEG